jgi:chromosome partitioning protein
MLTGQSPTTFAFAPWQSIKHDDAGGHVQLTPLLQTIARMQAIGVNPRVKIVPLGGDENSIKTCLEQAIDLSFEITETVPALPEIFGSAVYHDFDFAWNYPDCGYLYNIYRKIVIG